MGRATLRAGSCAAAWDSRGNLTSEPQSGKTYGYSSENLLTSASGGVTLGYDPAMRLYQVVGAATTRFAYDDVDAIAEYDGSGNLQRRFVFDPTTGQPVMQYEGTGTTSPRYLSQDERGSTISLTDGSGGLVAIDTYDEYGKPGASNAGRYQYTGQKWLSEANLYDYKARDYLPHLGIFAQTDPTGYRDGPNWYAYVHNDPVSSADPLGLEDPIFVTKFLSSALAGVYSRTRDTWSQMDLQMQKLESRMFGQSTKQKPKTERKRSCSQTDRQLLAIADQLTTEQHILEGAAGGSGAAAIAGLFLEVPTVGGDTPVTAGAGAATAAFGGGASLAGGEAGAIRSYVNGNPTALAVFARDYAKSQAAEAALRAAGLGGYAGAINAQGDLAGSLFQKEEAKQCG